MAQDRIQKAAEQWVSEILKGGKGSGRHAERSSDDTVAAGFGEAKTRYSNPKAQYHQREINRLVVEARKADKRGDITGSNIAYKAASAHAAARDSWEKGGSIAQAQSDFAEKYTNHFGLQKFVAKDASESLATVMRHDQDHDNWHKMHGDAPCTSEADCAQKRAKYAEVRAEQGVTKGGEGSGRHPERTSHETAAALQKIQDTAARMYMDVQKANGKVSPMRHDSQARRHVEEAGRLRNHVGFLQMIADNAQSDNPDWKGMAELHDEAARAHYAAADNPSVENTVKAVNASYAATSGDKGGVTDGQAFYFTEGDNKGGPITTDQFVKSAKKVKKGGPGSGRHKEDFSSKFNMRNYNQPSSKMTAKEMAAKRDEAITNANKLEKEFHEVSLHGNKDSNEKLAHLANMIAGHYRVAASLDPINHIAYDKQARTWANRAYNLQETVMHVYSAKDMVRGRTDRVFTKGGPGSGRHAEISFDVPEGITLEIGNDDAKNPERQFAEHYPQNQPVAWVENENGDAFTVYAVGETSIELPDGNQAHGANDLFSAGIVNDDQLNELYDNDLVSLNPWFEVGNPDGDFYGDAYSSAQEAIEAAIEMAKEGESTEKSALRKGGPGSGRHPQGWAGKYSGGAMSNYHDTRSEGQEDTSPAGQAHTDAFNDHLNNYGYTRTSDGRSKAEITDRAEAMSEAQGKGIDEPTRLALMSDAINTNLGDGHQWNDFEDSISATASDHEELSEELREQGFTASADAHLAAAQAFNDLISKGNFGNYTDEQLEEMANQANELAYTADSVTQDEIYRATQAPSRPADYKQSSVGAWLDRQEMLGKSSVRKGGPGSGRHPETGMPSNCGHRDFDPQTTVAQIGKMNILGLSGGRVSVLTEKNKPVGIELPIGHGYKVRVYLADNDTYTVQRVNVRAGKVNVKGEQTDVYADEVGEVAYNAGMYVNVSFGEDKR